MFRSVFPLPDSQNEVILQPSPFSARTPTIPIANSVSVCRLATTEGVDKRYERSWLKGLKIYFAAKKTLSEVQVDETIPRLMRRGDVFGVPVWLDKLRAPDDEDEDGDDEDEDTSDQPPTSTAVVYFRITAINYEPLVALEDDFRSSVSSKARAGELGCWIDVGPDGTTQMVLEGLERRRVAGRRSEIAWHNIRMSSHVQAKFTADLE